MNRISKIRTMEDGRDLMGLQMDCEIKSIGDLEIEIIGSTADQDRDGEVIDPKGWDLKNYKKNPVVLPSHDYRAPAIGKATSVKMKDGKLIFKIEFPPEGDYPLADVFRKLYKGGFMKASSIGFIPKEWIDGDGKKTPWRTYTKQELLEISLVTVPSNPNALVTSKGVESAVKQGVLKADDVKELMYYVRELIKKEGEQNGNDNAEIQSNSEGQSGGSDPEREEPEEGQSASGNESGNQEGNSKEEGKEESSGDEQSNIGEPSGGDNSINEDSKKRIADLEVKVKVLEDNIGELLKQLEEAINPKNYWDLPIRDKGQNESILSDIIETAREAFK